MFSIRNFISFFLTGNFFYLSFLHFFLRFSGTRSSFVFLGVVLIFLARGPSKHALFFFSKSAYNKSNETRNGTLIFVPFGGYKLKLKRRVNCGKYRFIFQLQSRSSGTCGWYLRINAMRMLLRISNTKMLQILVL